MNVYLIYRDVYEVEKVKEIWVPNLNRIKFVEMFM